jgi:hypothetical protein
MADARRRNTAYAQSTPAAPEQPAVPRRPPKLGGFRLMRAITHHMGA